MKFRTEISIPTPPFQISHHDQVMTMGSCFAGHISLFLENHGFQILGNPFGVLYNPVSIQQSLEAIQNRTILSKNDLVSHNNEWHSFLFDSQYSHSNQQKCLDGINSTINRAHEFLSSTNRFILTLGTSYVFRSKESGKIVSNCHKLPAQTFEHFRLSSEEILSSLKKIIKIIESINPNTRIIFTVSPVRHWKNGAIDNQLSKALLLLSVNELLTRYRKHCYFPAYELLMDDLRDYRYYDDDLLHPNRQAIEYILEKFSNAFFSEETIRLNQAIDPIILASEHRPRNKGSAQFIRFIQNQLQIIDKLQSKHTYIDLVKYQKYFKGQLNSAK